VNLAVRYKEELSRARQFLSASGRAKNGSSINDGRELTLLKNRAQCPHCGILFEGGNHNTEHIHPRALGGENTDRNRIQFCLACNNARNLVMQALLGHPPYFKNYPQNWPMVEEYLLWSEISIDDGLSAGNQVNSVHQKFLMCRFSGQVQPADLTSAYGRFSTWKKGDSPNYRQGTRQRLKRKQIVSQKPKRKGVFISVFDRLFGYGIIEEPPKAKAIATAQPAPVQNQTEQQPTVLEKTTAESPNKNNAVELKDVQESMTKFRSILLSFLGIKPISITHLAKQIEKYMESRDLTETTTTSFLKLFGLPKGLKKALETHLSEDVIISGTPPKYKVAIAPTPMSEPDIAPKPKSEPDIAPTPMSEPAIAPKPMSEFRSIMISFLSIEPVLIAQLAKKIEAYMKSQEFPETTTTSFLKLFGLPRGLKKAISKHLSETVRITGEVKKESVALIAEVSKEEE